MNKFSCLLAVALAAPAAAQSVRVAPTAAWVAPIVGAAIETKLGGSGSVALDNLTWPNQNQRLPFVDSPGLIKPLVDVIEAQGLTPEVFTSLKPAAKSKVLLAMARLAEERADGVAAAAVEATAAPLTASTYDRARERVQAAAELDAYLSAPRKEQLAKARATVAEARPKLQALFDAFTRDLPKQVAGGDFEGSTFIERYDDGWRPADEAPDRRYATLHELYNARLARFAERPGPWKRSEAALLVRSVVPDRIADSLEKESLGSAQLTLQAADSWLHDSESWTRHYPGMDATVARFQAEKARTPDFLKVEELYGSNLAASGDWTERARMIAAIKYGTRYLPNWENFSYARSKVAYALQENFHTGLVLCFLGLMAIVATAFGPLPLALAPYAVGLTVLNLAGSLYYGRRRDRLERGEGWRSRIQSALNGH